MRMRKKKNLLPRMEKCSAMIVPNPGDYRGHWHEYFELDYPISIEVGCGKGRFIIENALAHPDTLFIGIERENSALITALENSVALSLPNLMFLSCDGERLCDIFADGEVNRVFLNFSDPWPPKKHAKRRLTHSNFLNLYRTILEKDGTVEFKTDNQKLFEFSLNEMSSFPMTLHNISLDLHSSGIEGNIMTEYEEKFSSQGMPIYRLCGHFI